tara:strand:- start:330 stop:557 length:228 start_codon:yes stop_codon:yes gene_type:complete
MELKPNVTYNKPDNKVMVRTDGDFIYIISPSEKQTEQVVKRMTTESCELVNYEPWEDETVILTFQITENFDKVLN